MIGKKERLAKNDLHFFLQRETLKNVFNACQLETRRKCLTTFCYRLYPSVLKTADDLMQTLCFCTISQRLFYFVLLAFWGLLLHLLQACLLGLAFY